MTSLKGTVYNVNFSNCYEVLRKETDQQEKNNFTMKYCVYSSDLLEMKRCRILMLSNFFFAVVLLNNCCFIKQNDKRRISSLKSERGDFLHFF